MLLTKVALITGTRRGLGKACAYKFAQNGYDVVINDFKEYEAECKQIKFDIEKKYSVKVLVLCGNVSVEVDVLNMLEKFKTQYSNLNVLVNNAAIVEDMDVSKRSTELFEKTIRNNITGTYLMCKYFGKLMYSSSDISKIVNIASTNGIDCNFPTSIDYDASKAAIINLTKNFAIEYAPKILVNSVSPGWINTEMNQDLEKDLILEESSKIYLKRFAEPEEIASLVYYLSSEENTYINGENIVIDGGY